MRHLLAALLITTASSTATAEVMAEAAHGDVRIELHTDPGPCIGAARWALYLQGPQRIPGCWIALDTGTIQIAFLDGDIARLPMHLFSAPRVL